MHGLENTKMLGVLLDIEAGARESTPTGGICYNVGKAFTWSDGAGYWLRRAFRYLRLDKDYPVPHPDYRYNDDAFEQSEHLEKWAGPYGENRRHLLSLLIRLAAGESIGPADVAWPHPPKEKAVSITKRIESISNLQDLFNFAVKRVLANRRPAYSNTWDSCVYRASRIGGYRSCCVVGAVIPPELYTPEIEGKGVDGLVLSGLFDKVFPGNIRNIPKVAEFLRELQHAHDTHGSRWAKGIINRKEFQQNFLNAATRVAQAYGLDHTQVR